MGAVFACGLLLALLYMSKNSTPQLHLPENFRDRIWPDKPWSDEE